MAGVHLLCAFSICLCIVNAGADFDPGAPGEGQLAGAYPPSQPAGSPSLEVTS